MIAADSSVRITRVLDALEVPASSWYRKPTPASQRKRPGPMPRLLPESVVRAVVSTAGRYPWYGYKKIAVICRRAGEKVKNRHAYRIMKEHGLLQRRRCTAAEIHQASKLYELLPQGPNELWQMDITYIHIPGYGWWYAITVIDYFSRYLLACRLTNSYCAFEVTAALDRARAEAERFCGPLPKRPFLVTETVRASWPSGFAGTPGICTGTFASAIAHRRNWVCWNGFIGRSRPKKCTGVSMTVRLMPGGVWRSFACGTTRFGRTGP